MNKEYKRYVERAELESFVKDTNVNGLLKNYGYRNKPLDFDRAYALGVFTLTPYIGQLKGLFPLPDDMISKQSLAALCAFHNKATYMDEKSAEQIAGICAAVFDYDIHGSDNGFLCPDVPEVMDNCGMGGDLFRTPNLSTIAALVASADGVSMLKHGSPGNTDSVGSSDFLEHCGVNLFAGRETVENALKLLNFGYTDALDAKYKRIHTQTHSYAKLAHMNDIIGPVTNPVHPAYMKKRIIGINHLIPPERVAQAYRILNEKGVTCVEHGLFVRGFADEKRNGGIDEVSIMPGGTVVAELNDGQVRTYDLFARDFGLNEITADDLNPGQDKAETSRRILHNDICDGKREAVIANAAVILYLAKSMGFREGAEKARELLVSGKPYMILQEYAELSRQDKNPAGGDGR